MYSTPLKSKVDKNKASFYLSLLVKPEQKIKFAFCSDLIIENSLFNSENEHYFQLKELREFWTIYNSNRKRLYHTVSRHLKLDRETLQDCINNLSESTLINRSSLIFLSNNLSRNHFYASEIVREPDMAELPKLFYKTNKVTSFKSLEEFVVDDTFVFLECLVSDSHLKSNYDYFSRIIDGSSNICILTDQSAFKREFKEHIQINDNYYLCYRKEKK